MWEAFERYFSAKLIASEELSPDGLYIFGFHPHGIMPFTIFWSMRGSLWKSAFPGLVVDVLAASVMFIFPPMRELMLWAGGRDVSRRSFENALKESRSITMVPGGQREMGWSRSDTKKMTLVHRHKGFIRLALTHGVSLVPVISFGEDQILENINLPSIQNFTRPYLGFGFPMFPMGRWYSLFPVPQPITIAVGRAIPLDCYKHLLDPKGVPPKSLVDQIHKQYYEELTDLFEAHKAEAGFEDMELVLLER